MFDLYKFIPNLVQATESAALSSYKHVGMGNQVLADSAATDAMRASLNSIDFDGVIVIGEGERDKAPMLHIGEKVGCGEYKVDIATDPLEGTGICAEFGFGAMSVLSISQRGGLLSAPDIYMKKIAIGSGFPEGTVSLLNPVEENLINLANAKSCKMSDLVVVVLKRDRHVELIEEIRLCGAKVKLITDGDISAVMSLVLSDDIDMYVGVGGAPEGVLAASALSGIGGYIECKLIFDKPEDFIRGEALGINDFDKIYKINELSRSNSVFVATGVTDGDLLKGVKFVNNKVLTHSVVIGNNFMQNINNKYYDLIG